MSSFSMLQYQTDPPYSPTLLDDQGNAFVYLGYSPSRFSLSMQNTVIGVTKTGAGLFSLDLVNNIIAYQWNSGDTNVAGIWKLYLNVAMLSGFERRYEDVLYIEPAIP